MINREGGTVSSSGRNGDAFGAMMRGVMRLNPLRIALVYVAISLLWIALSDRGGEWVSERTSLDETFVQTLKGWAFVTASGVVLYVLIARYARQLVTKERTRLIQAEALAETRRAYQTLISNLPGMVYRCRNAPGWPMKFVSEGVIQLTGYTPDDFVVRRKGFDELIHPDDRERIWREVQAAIQEKRPYTLTYRLRTASGEQKWAWGYGRMVSEAGGTQYLEGYITDISELRKAEAEKALLSSAVESAAEVVFITDSDGHIQYVNKASESLIGQGRESLIGRGLEGLRDGGRLDALCLQFSEALGRETAWSGRIGVKDERGRPVELALTISPVTDGSGNITHYLAVGRDVGRETQLEAQLRQSQKLEAIGTLAGGIAHDFNNILSAILGYTQLAIAELSDKPDVVRDLGEVLRAGYRAQELVRQILTFSRRSEGEARPVRLDLVVREALKLLRASIPPNVDIQEDVDRSGATVLADEVQLHQVIMNLCTNAYQAMEETGGTLKVILEPVEVDGAFAKASADLAPGRYLRLSVQDTGHGMDAETMEHIFDPFFTTKPQGKGTGLGLATVYGIVRNCGGTITVYSEVGKGTTFHVYFPRIDAEAAVEMEENASAPRGSGERVLLVDDEEAVAELTHRVLARLGYEVLVRRNSKDALAAFQAHPDQFDAVVTDHAMPYMTGLELALEIKSIRTDIPIILMTGFSEGLDKKADILGIAAIVRKPFSPLQLAQALHAALHKERPF